MEIIMIQPISLFILLFLIGSLIVFYFYRLLYTYGIIVINFVVFLISLVFPVVINDLAFRPIYLAFQWFPQLYTLFTSMFLHSTQDIFHIVFNTLMFVLVAPHFEQHVGKKKFIALYLVTGVGAAVFHALLVPLIPAPFPFNPQIGLIGASGAISGIIGAYAIAYPRDRVFFPVGFFIMRIPILFAGVLFLAIQSLYVFVGGDPNVAYLAHIGGFFTGVVLSGLLLRPKILRAEATMPKQGFLFQPNQPSVQKKIDFHTLEKLALTPQEQRQLEKIKEESVPEVRDAWLDHFLDQLACPICNKPLHYQNGRLWCEENHFQKKYYL